MTTPLVTLCILSVDPVHPIGEPCTRVWKHEFSVFLFNLGTDYKLWSNPEGVSERMCDRIRCVCLTKSRCHRHHEPRLPTRGPKIWKWFYWYMLIIFNIILFVQSQMILNDHWSIQYVHMLIISLIITETPRKWICITPCSI